MIHPFSSAKAEGGDPTIVGPNEWNAPHVHGIRSISVSSAGATTDDWVKATAGAGGINYTLPAPATSGFPIYITKVDAAAGAVTILPHAGETINAMNVLGGASYLLVDPAQTVKLVSDGTNWWVHNAN